MDKQSTVDAVVAYDLGAGSPLAFLRRSSVITSLIPGFRNLRSALLTGVLIVVSVFVLLSGDGGTDVRLRPSAQEILDLSPYMPLGIGVLACYLVGSLYITGLEGTVDWIHRKMVHVQPKSVNGRIKRRAVAALVPFSEAARARLLVESRRFYIRYTEEHSRTDEGEAAFVNQVFADILWMEGKLAGTPLHDPYDEFRSEGELRLGTALTLPLVAGAASHAVHLSGRGSVLILTGSVLVMVRLADYGLYYFRRAHSFIAHHIADGTLLAPCMETLKHSNDS